MGAYTITKGGSIDINLAEDYRDNGWTTAGNVAKHSGCNQGFIKLNSVPYVVGVPNTFKYVVSNRTSGSVNIKFGSTSGPSETTDGVKTFVYTPSLGDVVSFYSDGNLWLELLEIYTVTENGTGTTLQFDEKTNLWITYYSFQPDFMIKFIDEFFTFKDGRLWLHHSNPIYNNFYGVQYTSKLTFYVNLSPTETKLFFSMRQKSNSVWTAENEGDIKTFPSQGKPNGQNSRLKAARFKRLGNDFFADFLRDMNDIRFISKQDALFKGALLEGNVMEITLENNSITEIRLLSVDITTAPLNYTY